MNIKTQMNTKEGYCFFIRHGFVV